MKPVKKATVLYMDDDSDDLQLLQEAFYSIDTSCEMLFAANGEEGLEKLVQLKASGELPCLIVLDVNMPRLDGRQTFLRLKADETFSTIPVVIFSTSDNKRDKEFFVGENVAYMVKPVEHAKLLAVARRLLNYCSF